jgi:hypothetical protein
MLIPSCLVLLRSLYLRSLYTDNLIVMASPNALALRLQQSTTYQRLPMTYRDSWLSSCLKLPPEDIDFPLAEQTFPGYRRGDRLILGELVTKRLRSYGLVTGCSYVRRKTEEVAANDTACVEIRCIFHGSKTLNTRKLLADEVEYDGDQITSDRQRNKVVRKKGCRVMYRLSWKLVPGSSEVKEWRGSWSVPPSFHTEKHEYPTNPFLFTSVKRMVSDYRLLESIGRTYRMARMKYKTARKMFREEGTMMLMSSKEYYNLAAGLIRDLDDDDTAGALSAIFDQERGWEYEYNVRISDDGGHQITQIFFWCDDYRTYARRFTSNSLLVVDATWRTNNRGLPLLMAVGKSNTGKTFPVAFCWIPEEDAESYKFFFDCLRDIFYQDIPDPATVLTDLSSGMTSAYDKLKCLPYSELQYCVWHAEEAMKRWFRESGYTSQEQEELGVLAKVYLQSATLDELEVNRRILANALQPQHRQYITITWREREGRVVECFTRYLSNLGARATQMSEVTNKVIHEVCHHQMPLRRAAQEIINWVNDFSRDFEEELDKARGYTFLKTLDKPYELLTGTVTLEAINKVKEQWRKLVEGSAQGECSNSYRKQYLLPCSHDLRLAFDTGIPIPKSLLHPRYWIEGYPPQEQNWQPAYTPIPMMVAPTTERNINRDIEGVLALRDSLPPQQRREYEGLMRQIMQQFTEVGQQLQRNASRPLQLPAAREQAKSYIPTANEAALAQARQQSKLAVQLLKDQRLLKARLQKTEKTQSRNMATTPPPTSPLLNECDNETITVAIPLRPSPSKPLLQPEEEGQEDGYLPPASTAPPAVEIATVTSSRGRAHRKRDYAAMNSGQE